ncbi:MAG: FAD:protein FMN transferase, partial [Psychroflexus sp.]|nr:FAD:protein FMN transferase [Psychroflexus sp.]
MRPKIQILILIITVLLFSCDDGFNKYEVYGNALGTTYSVNYYAQQDQNIKPKFDSIFQVINLSLSTYITNSDISKLNSGIQAEVDNHFKNVFKAAKITLS